MKADRTLLALLTTCAALLTYVLTRRRHTIAVRTEFLGLIPHRLKDKSGQSIVDAIKDEARAKELFERTSIRGLFGVWTNRRGLVRVCQDRAIFAPVSTVEMVAIVSLAADLSMAALWAILLRICVILPAAAARANQRAYRLYWQLGLTAAELWSEVPEHLCGHALLQLL